jgi:hypothetical protein
MRLMWYLSNRGWCIRLCTHAITVVWCVSSRGQYARVCRCIITVVNNNNNNNNSNFVSAVLNMWNWLSVFSLSSFVAVMYLFTSDPCNVFRSMFLALWSVTPTVTIDLQVGCATETGFSCNWAITQVARSPKAALRPQNSSSFLTHKGGWQLGEWLRQGMILHVMFQVCC